MFIVSGPVADLHAIVEVARSHDDTTLAKPFPVAGLDAVNRVTFRPDTAVLVVVDYLLRFTGLLFGHLVAFNSDLGRCRQFVQQAGNRRKQRSSHKLCKRFEYQIT